MAAYTPTKFRKGALERDVETWSDHYQAIWEGFTPDGPLPERPVFSDREQAELERRETAALANYVAKDARILNVKDFGAKGNGAANDTAAINAALGALTPGDTLIFPPGRYMTSGGHHVTTPSVKIEGPTGRAQTYNSSAQLFLRNGANADMLTIDTNQVTVRDLTLHGQYSGQTAPSRGLVTSTLSGSYNFFDAVWVTSFNGDGMSFESSSGTTSNTIVNCESRVNQGYGMRFYGTSTDSMVSNCYIDQNVQSGVYCSSGDLSMTSCHLWGNGTGTTGERDGITFQSSAGCRIINCFIETQLNGAGIRFKTGANKGHIIQGCDIWGNGLQGIYAYQASNCVFTGNVVRQNNYKGQVGGGGAGLFVDSCTALLITGNQFFSSGANRQTYGYYEFGTANVDIRFTDNMSRAADHTTGGVFLGPGTRADLGSSFRSKAADQSIVNSNVLIDDADLQIPVAAGEVWQVEGLLFVDGPQAADLAVRISAPPGATGYWRALGPAGSATSTTAVSINPGAATVGASMGIGLLGAGVVTPVKIEGLVTVTTAGTLLVRWAQQAIDPAVPVIVKAGSHIQARRVAQ